MGIQNFLQFVYKNSKTQTTWEAGLYVKNDAEIRRLANSFSLSQTKIGMTQRIHTSFSTTVKSMNALPEFIQIVNTLPAWNPQNPSVRSLYDMLIQFFGTDVSIATEHGGVIYQQSTIKECFGGDAKPGMRADMQTTINKQPPNTSGYYRFRQLGVLNILGGNPELGIDKIQQRINSFDQAPAPVKFTTVPLWEVIQNGNQKNWVKAAIEDYIQKNQPNVQTMMNEIIAARDRNFKGPQRIFTMETQTQQDWVLVTHWKNCPIARQKNSVYTPDCAVIGQPSVLSAGQRQNTGGAYNNNQAVVERNPSNGFVRIYNTEGGKVKATSGWINKGCAKVPFGPRVCVKKRGAWWRTKTFCLETSTKLSRMVCIDCVPSVKPGAVGKFNLRHTYPECHCAGF
jgi:hypothetical protein